MQALTKFSKRHAVLTVSFILAVLSCFITPPNPGYLKYIDYRTICLLFSFMCVIAGLRRLGLFDELSKVIIRRTTAERSVAAVLVVMSFGMAMFLTNDITLVTLVPLTLIIFANDGSTIGADQKRLLVVTLVIESLAANFGGMMMPFGSPQNIYLYSFFNLTMRQFFTTMLPYAVPGLVILLVIIRCIKFENTIDVARLDALPPLKHTPQARWALVVFLILFGLAILSVAKVVNYLVATAVILLAMVILDRRAILKVNYVLLLTFIFFFIFVGNISRLTMLQTVIQHSVHHHEVLVSILASQVTSNVPAAILISKFTHDGLGILIGTNVGGMGTLIASMASLITYQLLTAKYPDTKGMFIKYFSLYNFALLVLYYGYYLLLHHFI